MRLILALVFLSLASCAPMESNENRGLASEGLCTNCSKSLGKVEESSPTQILNQTRTLQSYRTCLGAKTLDETSVTKYNTIKSNLSYGGEASSINNTVVFTNVKAAVVSCHAAIEYAKRTNDRTVFMGFSLDNVGFGNPDQEGTIQKIAQNCWGRKATQQEIDFILNKSNQIFIGGQRASRDAAMFICIAMLSTPDAMKQ
ncbi:MAG: hypothetical protein KDD33_04750 [Bdellovibrionales bacterium]|nr:hypothetical protein [Bdellovibrionales bacterium]